MASSTPLPPADSSTSHNVKVKGQAFKDAYQRFFKSLSPKEQLLYSPCASHDDFIDAMRKLEEVAHKRRKRGGSRFLDRIARLSNRLRPFFEVVNIMIQSNPEYTALAWGALRFVLQLASGFNTFFEKLLATLECFCDEIPRYENLQLLVLQGGQISNRIKECTEKVYGHMFQFFREVANVFTSDGRIKRTPVIIADILWRPFEDRFDGLLKQIQSCRHLVEFDIVLLQARIANDTKAIAAAQKEIAEKEREERISAQKKADELAAMNDEIVRMISQSRREQLFERIQKWLSPPQYSDALFHGKSLREPGTNEWIFTNPRFCEWRQREWAIRLSGDRRKTGPNILWIKGNPGSGKSVLASSVIDKLKAANNQGCQTREVCYCFFTPDCKDSSTRISAYRSILAQILHKHRQNDEVIGMFDFIMTDRSSSGTPKAGLDELFGLVKLLFQRFQIFLVLDGIDECEDDFILMGEIVELSESSSAKILLCGRTNTESLIRTVPTSSQIRLDRDVVNADIRLFISTQVDLLLDDELIPPNSNSEDLVNRLCTGADGMFLWAKLMFKYLGLPVHYPHSRLKVIRSVVSPEGLEKMYDRIIHAISQAGETWRDFASRILTWASYSLQPLTSEELYNQMTFDTSNTTHVDSDQLKAFEEKVCIVCRGLIEFSNVPSQPSAHRILRYIHLSVKERFSRGHQVLESRDTLVSWEAIEQSKCARKCLEYLLYHVPAREGRLGHPGPTNLPLGAFSGYAAKSWVTHLDRLFASASSSASDISNSSSYTGLASSLSSFLKDSTKVKFWIHVLYSHSNPCTPDGIPSCLDELVSTLSNSHRFPASMRDLSGTMHQFCRDVSKALNAWDKHLRNSTEVLWDEMTIFSESPFMVGPRKGQVVSMAPTPPPGNMYSKFCQLCKISHTGVDGKSTAVLSLWGDCWETQTTVAKYELWKHNTVPTRLSEIVVPIGDIDYESPPFYRVPLSISDDLGSFAATDRLFALIPNSNKAPISTCSTKIPILHRTSSADTHTTFFKLSAQGRFLLSSNSSFSTSGQRKSWIWCTEITMFEIENGEQLQIRPIKHEDLRHWDFSNVSEAIFHPYHPVVIIRGENWVCAWNFAKDYGIESKSSFQILHCNGKVKNMTLSSCGKFVVWEGSTEAQPTIFPIPKWFLTPHLPSFNEVVPSPLSDFQRDKSTPESFLSTRQGESALQLSPGRPVQSGQILTLPDGMPAQLISVQGGEEIKIARVDLHSKRADEVLNVIRLPQGQGMNGATTTILTPAPGDESIRIILDENGRVEQRQTNELPVFISRDINAIKQTFYDGVWQRIDGGRAAARQQIRSREEIESEKVAKRRRIGTD